MGRVVRRNVIGDAGSMETASAAFFSPTFPRRGDPPPFPSGAGEASPSVLEVRRRSVGAMIDSRKDGNGSTRENPPSVTVKRASFYGKNLAPEGDPVGSEIFPCRSGRKCSRFREYRQQEREKRRFSHPKRRQNEEKRTRREGNPRNRRKRPASVTGNGLLDVSALNSPMKGQNAENGLLVRPTWWTFYKHDGGAPFSGSPPFPP